MAIKTSGASSPSISKYVRGLGLCGLRQKRGVSLEQIAEKTKISIRFLRAIESEEFEKLPGGLFTTSYIRQYAAAVGLDEAELITQYERKTGRNREPVEDAKPKPTGAETTRGWFGPLARHRCRSPPPLIGLSRDRNNGFSKSRVRHCYHVDAERCIERW